MNKACCMKVYSTWLIINSILYNHSCKILYISDMNGSHYIDSCNPVYGGDRILWRLVIFPGEILSLIHCKQLKKLYIWSLIGHWPCILNKHIDHYIGYSSTPELWACLKALTMHSKPAYWPLYNKYFKGYLRTLESWACLCSKQANWSLYIEFSKVI